MDTTKIYLLDEKIPTNKLIQDFDTFIPKTKEEVVDLIISKVVSNDNLQWKNFLLKYESRQFIRKQLNEKKEILEDDFDILEKRFQDHGTWNEANKLKADLMNTTFSFHILNDANVLYQHQIENEINIASELSILLKKKEFLLQEIDKINSLVQYENNIKKEDKLKSGNALNDIPDELIEEPPVDMISILMKCFPKYEQRNQLDNLIKALETGTGNPNIEPIKFYGKREDLWKAIGYIRSKREFHYKNTANAISKFVLWSSKEGSPMNVIKYSSVISNMYMFYKKPRKSKEK